VLLKGSETHGSLPINQAAGVIVENDNKSCQGPPVGPSRNNLKKRNEWMRWKLWLVPFCSQSVSCFFSRLPANDHIRSISIASIESHPDEISEYWGQVSTGERGGDQKLFGGKRSRDRRLDLHDNRLKNVSFEFWALTENQLQQQAKRKNRYCLTTNGAPTSTFN
jgi:hypothetical protein